MDSASFEITSKLEFENKVLRETRVPVLVDFYAKYDDLRFGY